MRSMKTLLGGAVLAAGIVMSTVPATADVRDDFRQCEIHFLSKIRRGSEPHASSPREEYCLGLGYWFQSPGNRLPRDPVKAVYWHSRAAEHGVVPAQVALAYHYEKGHGVAQDVSKAVALYRAAAEKGDASARFNLGRLSSIGRGVPQDAAEAEKLFKRAEEEGSTDAKVHFRKTREYELLNSAERQSYEAGYRAYQAKNYTAALGHFRQASDMGHAQGRVALGELYRLGQGVPKDLRAAAELYRLAAEQGYARGQAELGRAYELGEGVPEDWARAIEWYKKSAEQLNAVGLSQLGRAYQFGIGVPQDRQIAVSLFEKAENQGDRQAGFFARWLRSPGNCLGYIDHAERLKFAGVCADPKGIAFKSSRERRAWLADQQSKIQVDFFDSSGYVGGACRAMGADFRSGNCYGAGGIIIDPLSNQDRYGNRQW